MTDITELAQSLKAAAEKATQGNWRAFKYHDGRCGIGGGRHDEIMVCEHISKRRPHDAEFIAMANPANVRALVEALEKAQQRIGKLEKKLTDHKRMNQEMAKAMLTPNDSDAAGMEIAALRQRIAELESNEVREEGNQFLVVRHPGKVPVIKHPVGELEDYLRQILKADPLATIDIVTHRYYGVGGQFVEDADEYLHEMSIKVEAE